MSEQDTENNEQTNNENSETTETVAEKNNDIIKKLKNIIFAIVALAVIVFVFGKIVPQLLYGTDKNSLIKTSEITREHSTDKEMSDDSKNALSLEPSREQPAEQTPPLSETPKISESHEPSQIPPLVRQIIPDIKPHTETEQNEQKIKDLEEKISNLQNSYEEKINRLEKNISEKTAAQNKSGDVLFSVLVFNQLKEDIENGVAYSEQLNKLQQATKNNRQAQEIINRLQPYSQTGVANIYSLQSDFPALARKALESQKKNFFKRTLNKFISIRKTGEQQGGDDEAIIARAESRLKQGNIAASLRELDLLSEPTDQVFATWKSEAQKLIDTENNLKELQQLLIRTDADITP